MRVDAHADAAAVEDLVGPNWDGLAKRSRIDSRRHGLFSESPDRDSNGVEHGPDPGANRQRRRAEPPERESKNGELQRQLVAGDRASLLVV